VVTNHQRWRARNHFTVAATDLKEITIPGRAEIGKLLKIEFYLKLIVIDFCSRNERLRFGRQCRVELRNQHPLNEEVYREYAGREQQHSSHAEAKG
jgi:hypothetical protein